MTDEQKYESLQKFNAKWKPGMPWRVRRWDERAWETHTGSDMPSLSWRLVEYDLIPAPAVEPWTFEEAPPVLKVRSKSDGQEAMAIARPNGWFELGFGPHNMTFVTEVIFARDFEQLDGSPCGKVATV